MFAKNALVAASTTINSDSWQMCMIRSFPSHDPNIVIEKTIAPYLEKADSYRNLTKYG